MKQHRHGDLARLDWLDPLSLHTVAELQQREQEGAQALYLAVKWPTFDAPVVFHEPGCDAPPLLGARRRISPGVSLTHSLLHVCGPGDGNVLDPEALHADNLVRARALSPQCGGRRVYLLTDGFFSPWLVGWGRHRRRTSTTA